MNPYSEYYSREFVQEELFKIAKDREVQIWMGDVRGRRPEVVNFLGDIKDLVKQGMTSFHVSEERWHDPLSLKAGMPKRKLDELRLGWDCILDLDSKCLDYSRYAAELLIEAFKFSECYGYSLKFSGNHGFHIAVPFEAFPDEVNGIKTKDLFPDGIRVIAAYLKEMIREFLTEKILNNSENSFDVVAERVSKKKEDIVKNGVFDPFEVIDIDSILISSRHLFRAVYSVNEKSGLVSIPVESPYFDINDAKPENVTVKKGFLDRENVVKGSATQLLVQAFDWYSKKERSKVLSEEKVYKDYELPQVAIKEDFFPPCIKCLLEGVSEDGRKRAVFLLVNFLHNMGWDSEKIKECLLEWNKKNYEELKEGYILTQINWFKRQNKRVPPPNCANKSYYSEIGICKPENLCRLIKNPAQFVMRKIKLEEQKKPKRTRKD